MKIVFQLIFTIISVSSFAVAMPESPAAPKPAVDPAEIQAAFETAFQTGSTAALVYTQDHVSHYVGGQDEWTMLLAAQASLFARWKMQLAPAKYQISIGAAIPGPNTNTRIYPFTVHYSSLRFKAPFCLDYTIDLEGEIDVYQESDSLEQQRGIFLKSFTPRITNTQQCV